MTETPLRSLVKTISWRLTGSGATFLLAYIVLQDLTISSTIAISQLILNTILYFIHERLWNKINWQRNS